MTWVSLLTQLALILDFVVKAVAVGVVPENRRPSSSQAWLLLILFVPVLGVPLFLLIGSPYVRGRRHRIQTEANQLISTRSRELPLLPPLPFGTTPSPAISSVIAMGRDLTGLPCTSGTNHGFLGDTEQTYQAIADAVDQATTSVWVEFYIMAWDDTTDCLFQSLARAVERGVEVRLLMDHLGSRKYRGWRAFRRRLSQTGIDWHLMMPINPLQGRWRRPDLRNHRKLVVIDQEVAFIGSHNVIDPSYHSRRNEKIGRRWKDLSVKVSGPVASSIGVVFTTDWYTETGEVLEVKNDTASDPITPDGPINAFQVVPSGPGYPTEPNLRLFTALVHQAVEHISIVSPYFVPDESLLGAITTACYRGVTVDLYVGEQADQFFVGHAQRSYYRALLEAGVRIHLFPKPTILHSKYLVIDRQLGAIGSSNMDFRSFALDYEVTLLGFGGDFVDGLIASDREYQQASRLLTLDEWNQQPWVSRYLDNACRLTSALM